MAFRKPRAGALDSLTECPLDTQIIPHSSALIPINRGIRFALRMSKVIRLPSRLLRYFKQFIPHPPSLIPIYDSRFFLLMCYGAFRKPRAGALGSLTECPIVCDLL